MLEENRGGKILAMYDIRGIQRFIFRTNKVKEIKGASRIVENIIEKALAHGLNAADIPQEQYILSWENNEELKILSDENMAAQVLFIGGGNAYVMYRDRELAVKVNKKMARYVLDETYSLQLAIAMVNKTESYAKDYQSVQNEMTRIKASMPYSGCLGAVPVVAVDDMTGFPYSLDGLDRLKEKPQFGEENESERLSYESIQKLLAYYESDKEGREKEHNSLITEYGKESILAVVHMDGNNMGMRIRSLMEGVEDYGEAVRKMRTVSKNINDSFKKTFDETADYIQDWVQSSEYKVLKKKVKGREVQYIRKILVAGDDITFVCNAKLALPFVKHFIQLITGKVMFGEMTEDNIEKYGFSICAGMAYVHSHFPFHSAYEVAEECCSFAKKRAKEENNKLVLDNNEERIANWVDFQICKSVHSIDLAKSRQKNYMLSQQEYLLRRPYYMEVNRASYKEFNELNKEYSYKNFEDILEYFKDDSNMPHSLAKGFRNTYPLGKNALDELIAFARSRKKLTGRIVEETLSGSGKDFGFVELNGKKVAAWYDALEMMDYYISLERKVSKEEEA